LVAVAGVMDAGAGVGSVGTRDECQNARDRMIAKAISAIAPQNAQSGPLFRSKRSGIDSPLKGARPDFDRAWGGGRGGGYCRCGADRCGSDRAGADCGATDRNGSGRAGAGRGDAGCRGTLVWLSRSAAFHSSQVCQRSSRFICNALSTVARNSRVYPGTPCRLSTCILSSSNRSMASSGGAPLMAR
jgi:hypothetical protein